MRWVRVRAPLAQRAASSSVFAQSYSPSAIVPRSMRNGLAIAAVGWLAVALGVILYLYS
jgi:hypothetical protein